MDIKDIVKDLTRAVVARQTLSSDPYNAAEDAIATYNILIVNLMDVQASKDALDLTVSVLQKPEVDLEDPPAFSAEKIYRYMVDKISG